MQDGGVGIGSIPNPTCRGVREETACSKKQLRTSILQLRTAGRKSRDHYSVGTARRSNASRGPDRRDGTIESGKGMRRIYIYIYIHVRRRRPEDKRKRYDMSYGYIYAR